MNEKKAEKLPRRVHWDEIWTIAKAHHLEDPLQNLETFRRFLVFWFCRKYNRPLKDPLIASYTVDELLYEFIRHFYSDPENDPRKEMMEKSLQAEDDEWVKQMLAKAKEMQGQTSQSVPAPVPPTSQPVPAVPDLPEISTSFDSDPTDSEG